MNFSDDDDSVFEQALRADLPSMSEQNRMRQRMLAAGIAAGTALSSTSVAAGTQASVAASALSKLSALSWPAKLGLAAALAAPVAALPAVYPPSVRAADLVSQVQSSAATVHARAAAQLSSPARLRVSDAPQIAEPARAPVTAEATAPSVVTPTARGSAAGSGAQPSLTPSPVTNDSVVDSPANDAPSARAASTLAAETQLLDRAFAALAAGDRSTASALVNEHARLFPNGLLRQERERARARIAANSTGE